MKYSIPDYVDYVRVDDKRAVLSSPLEKKELTGETVDLVSELIPLLRDGATIEELSDASGETARTIETLLEILKETGQIHSETPSEAGFWDWASDSPDEVRNRLESSTVGIFTATDESRPQYEWAETEPIDSVGNISAMSSELDLLVTLSSGVRPSLHRAILEETSAVSLPWLSARLVGNELRIGPLTQPTGDACYNCYYQRSLASQSEPSLVSHEHDHRENSGMHPPYLDSIFRQLHSMVEMEAAALLSGFQQPNTVGTVLIYDIFQQTTTYADVLSLPGCEICGTN